MSDVQIHWFSIVNSVVVVFFLSGILSMIIIRTLRKDIANYNREDDIVRDPTYSAKYDMALAFDRTLCGCSCRESLG